ncbi:YqgE/AlgH family protein [Leptobacterium flavescens]|uniref:YqgE/AlgH family protein n=1 Tax=Leptobacterium flavescens TaxID=472055 RepID=A0A6P0UJ25_9FLAO|nr:YqgE/AlgH family protein [Leptobacterium flavescens]NER11928.1 YqgE/AlgH family protein [Leptobacterium flavescens]
MVALKPKKGHLLIAEPSIIGDVSFNRSVVLLAEHNDEGSIGFILNKPLSFRLNELVPEIKKSIKVYNGGPVEQDNLYFIHKVPHLITNSIEISNGVYWGGDFETIIDLINDNTIKAGDIRFFLGYSGWELLQLDKELQSSSWVVLENIYKSNIIKKSASSFWKEKMLELGGDYLLWSNAPENPGLN